MARIPLTQSVSVEDGSHILYFYHRQEAYLENATSFILTGIRLNQHVVYIDTPSRLDAVLERLGSDFNRDSLHFFSSDEFYEIYRDFDYDRILRNLDSAVKPFVTSDTVVRMWGHVALPNKCVKEQHISEQLTTYERVADASVAELGYTTVCAYDATTMPAHLLLAMMKTHSLLMTDEQLVRSNLYKTSNDKNPAIFPSISVQHDLESEMDLYKQKLDFVHVVSHEVRNPLTVINAYASLLAADEQNSGRRSKLEAIMNYVAAIDHELAHIITTEQMLNTDAVWHQSLTKVTVALEDALAMMKVKAITQNITLKSDIQLCGIETVLANRMGLKMILTNLLSNAIKYSSEGQTVHLRLWTKARTLLITVTDEGVGMSEEQQSKLFRKYEKMNNEASGQGIGLFMVKKLVDHFGGTIEVESTPGRGSQFRVQLPLAGGHDPVER